MSASPLTVATNLLTSLHLGNSRSAEKLQGSREAPARHQSPENSGLWLPMLPLLKAQNHETIPAESAPLPLAGALQTNGKQPGLLSMGSW